MFDIAAATSKNPNYREDINRRIAELKKFYTMQDYQEQLDSAGIPVKISEFADQDDQVIKCIVGGLLKYAPKKIGEQ